MKRSGWGRWLLLALVVAVVAHVSTVWLLPRVIMRIATNAMAAREGHNRAVFPPRADETARTIVRPSPDLLYAGCAFDLASGPVRLRAVVPKDTYWSLSMFGANTDNFFVVNDRVAQGGAVDLVLAPPGAKVALPAGATLVEAPSMRGIVLTRTLIASAARLGELDEARRHFTCAPLS
ncbi:DUF1254 domain-containing protein [Candidatus Binatia bacterium]|jgi:uncharacterized membrane protein|nr:DUF1254 domain-containing protein [Candidatus Binatia bacterium]